MTELLHSATFPKIFVIRPDKNIEKLQSQLKQYMKSLPHSNIYQESCSYNPILKRNVFCKNLYITTFAGALVFSCQRRVDQLQVYLIYQMELIQGICDSYMLQLGRISKTIFCKVLHFTSLAESLIFCRQKPDWAKRNILNGINIANPLPMT